MYERPAQRKARRRTVRNDPLRRKAQRNRLESTSLSPPISATLRQPPRTRSPLLAGNQNPAKTLIGYPPQRVHAAQRPEPTDHRLTAKRRTTQTPNPSSEVSGQSSTVRDRREPRLRLPRPARKRQPQLARRIAPQSPAGPAECSAPQRVPEEPHANGARSHQSELATTTSDPNSTQHVAFHFGVAREPPPRSPSESSPRLCGRRRAARHLGDRSKGRPLSGEE